MILNQSPKQNVINNAITSQTLKISEDAQDQALLVDLQISKLYQNKIASTIREYISNAKDANVAAGKADIPVNISLPTNDVLFFSVSDSGLGLSPEQIEKYFCSIGASSKRNTNNQIGSYGLGLKVGFAYIKQYGYQFNITTVSNGVKYFYVAHYDEHNYPRVSLMGSENTNDVGTIVSVPVHSSDVNQFVLEAENLLKFWKEYLKFEIVSDHVLNLEIGDLFYDCLEYSIYVPNKNKSLRLHTHNVVSIDGLPYSNQNINTYNHIVVAKIGIGVLDLVPSREFLEVTKNNDNVLKPIFESAVKHIIAHYQKYIDTFSSEFDIFVARNGEDGQKNSSQNDTWNYKIESALTFNGNNLSFNSFSQILFAHDRLKYCYYYKDKEYKHRPVFYVHTDKISITYRRIERIDSLKNDEVRCVVFDDSDYFTSWNPKPNYYKEWPLFEQKLREQFLAKSVHYSTIKKTRPKRETESEPTAWVLENSRFVPVFDDVSDLDGVWFVGSKMKPTNQNVMNVLTKTDADWSSKIIKSEKIYMIPKRNEKLAKENGNLKDIVETVKEKLLETESIQEIYTDLICNLFGKDLANSLWKNQTTIVDKTLVDFLKRGLYVESTYDWDKGYKPGEHLRFYTNIFGKSYDSPDVVHILTKYKLCSGFKNSAATSMLELVNYIGGAK